MKEKDSLTLQNLVTIKNQILIRFQKPVRGNKSLHVRIYIYIYIYIFDRSA